MGSSDHPFALVYELYSQGLSQRHISEALGLTIEQVKYRTKKYARDCSAPYPVPRTGHNGQYLYDLYVNQMPVSAISQLLGLKRERVYLRIKAFALENGLPNPIGRKGELASKLLEQGYTYEQAAKMSGYHDRSACFRGVKAYRAKLVK